MMMHHCPCRPTLAAFWHPSYCNVIMYERTVCASKSYGIVYFHDVILAMHPSFEKFAVILKKGECRSKG